MYSQENFLSRTMTSGNEGNSVGGFGFFSPHIVINKTSLPALWFISFACSELLHFLAGIVDLEVFRQNHSSSAETQLNPAAF